MRTVLCLVILAFWPLQASRYNVETDSEELSEVVAPEGVLRTLCRAKWECLNGRGGAGTVAKTVDSSKEQCDKEMEAEVKDKKKCRNNNFRLVEKFSSQHKMSELGKEVIAEDVALILNLNDDENAIIARAYCQFTPDSTYSFLTSLPTEPCLYRPGYFESAKCQVYQHSWHLKGEAKWQNISEVFGGRSHCVMPWDAWAKKSEELGIEIGSYAVESHEVPGSNADGKTQYSF